MTKSLRDAKANELFELTKVAVTATTGTLPTATGAQVIADTATPTVVELLKLCMELKAQLDLISN